MRSPNQYLNKFVLDLSKKHRWSTFFVGEPTVLELEVTTYCNIKCIQCSRQGEYAGCLDLNQHMPFDKFKFIINKFPYLERITFSGMGEPLLYPEIFDAVNYVKNMRKDTKVGLSTNTTLFIDPSFIDKVAQSNIDVLQISWLGANPETVERIGAVKNFAKMVEGVRRLILKKPSRMSVFLNFVLMHENFGELPDLIRLIHSVGIKSIVVSRRNFLSYAKDSMTDADFYESEDLRLKIDEARELAQELKVGFNYNPKPRCISLWEYTTINVNGYVLPCGSYDMPKLHNLGNIINDDKKKIYRSPLLKFLRREIAAKRKPEFCKNCYLADK